MLRAPAPHISFSMGANKKQLKIEGLAYDPKGPLYEVREVDAGKPPVFLLKGIENLRVATSVSELGVLSKLEEIGAFSKLESLGAFSVAEKALPIIENLRILTFMENTVNTEAGLLFSIANWLLAAFPIYVALAICGFAPIPGLGEPLFFGEAGLFLTTTALGAALWAWAFAVSKLQDDAYEQDRFKYPTQ